MVHVSAQEAHFLMGLLDLGTQLLQLLLQVWRGQEGQEAGSPLKGLSQETQEANLSLANGVGSGLKQGRTRLGDGENLAPREPFTPQRSRGNTEHKREMKLVQDPKTTPNSTDLLCDPH